MTDSQFPIPDSRVVHVAAAVLRDAGGRILLARRTHGRDLAGRWEFPGGKVEAGETPRAALARELREELGIEIEDAVPLIAVPQAYPHKRILLDVYTLDGWRGRPRGLEKQALAWAPAERLATYPMPPADIPVVAALRDPDTYLITPEPAGDRASFLRRLQRALDDGIRRVQLRARTLDADALKPLAIEAAARCRTAGAQLLVNGEIALARALGVGVHLRATQLAALEARALPPALPVAASCHDAAELRRAEALGCDFAVLGPVAPTPGHADATPLGWPGFAALREQVSLPIYALGGMRPEDIAEARRHGAQGIAAMRALWPS